MGGQRNKVEDQKKQRGWSKKTRSGGQKKNQVGGQKNTVRGLKTQGVKKQGGESKKTRGDQKNKVGGLKNKGPVYFDKISCTCAAQHYLYNNRAKLLVSTENLVKVFKHSCG